MPFMWQNLDFGVLDTTGVEAQYIWDDCGVATGYTLDCG